MLLILETANPFVFFAESFESWLVSRSGDDPLSVSTRFEYCFTNRFSSLFSAASSVLSSVSACYSLPSAPKVNYFLKSIPAGCLISELGLV